MSEKLNFHKLHEERNVLRNLDDAGELSSDVEQDHKYAIEGVHRSFQVRDHGGLSGAKQELRRQKQQFEGGYVTDWTTIRASLGNEASHLLDTVEKKSGALTSLIQSRAKKLREMNGNPKKTELYKALIQAIGSDLVAKENELHELEAEHPHIFRIKDLLAYREGLFEEGHIAEVPSVQVYLKKIEEAMIEGKPMFLHGPTGTGKTSLAIRTAKVLTGKEPEIVYCNPQTKESNIFGKTGVGIDEKTEKQVTQFDYGPLVRAMKEGRVVIFDEFTALPKDMMVMLKGIMHARVGDTRTIPGDGEVPIAPGFQMIFTANLKSEKNEERQDIPPEMANEFAQNNLEVKYQSVDESYDIMLARLMSREGTISMSPYDMEVTLPKFCQAIAEIQRAYTDKVESDMGGKEGLKKLVFNQRTVENILSRWHTKEVKGEEGDFVTFLDEQLSIPLTFREYSEKDRVLTAKILARHGLLSTIDPVSLGLSSDVFSFNAKSGDGNVEESDQREQYTLPNIAGLDPFERRGGEGREDIDALVDAIEPPHTTESPNDINMHLKALGSPATVDISIERGLFTFSIDAIIEAKLRTPEGAKKAFIEADGGSASNPWDGFFDTTVDTWEPLTKTTLDTCIVSHGQTTQAQRAQLVTHMESLGYRPPTRTELLALAITRPDLNKIPDRYLTTLKEYSLGGRLQAPYFLLYDSERRLNANDVSNDWYGRSRFLFVRKT